MYNLEKNGRISFYELEQEYFCKYKVYIPLIQRNYKWDKGQAKKLATDIWNAYQKKQEMYTVGMITFCEFDRDKEEKMLQLIDGQQRIITLYMLLKLICQGPLEWSFDFERDERVPENRKRKTYLSKINECASWVDKEISTDARRFRNNYMEMKTGLGNEMEKMQDFKEYIENHVYFLIHVSEIEPLDEFMNLNKNKTRFVVSDKIKASMVMEAEAEQRNQVLELFEKLSKCLYSNSEVWDLLSKGYLQNEVPETNEERKERDLYPDENRLKILCCDRYGANETAKYEWKSEFETLSKYRKILADLENDIKGDNWNSYNAFNYLHHINSRRFFEILNLHSEEKVLERAIFKEFKNENVLQKVGFAEVLLQEGRIDENKLESIVKEDFFKDDFGNNGEGLFDHFEEILETYINEKYKEEDEINK